MMRKCKLSVRCTGLTLSIEHNLQKNVSLDQEASTDAFALGYRVLHRVSRCRACCREVRRVSWGNTRVGFGFLKKLR